MEYSFEKLGFHCNTLSFLIDKQSATHSTSRKTDEIAGNGMKSEVCYEGPECFNLNTSIEMQDCLMSEQALDERVFVSQQIVSGIQMTIRVVYDGNQNLVIHATKSSGVSLPPLEVDLKSAESLMGLKEKNFEKRSTREYVDRILSQLSFDCKTNALCFTSF